MEARHYAAMVTKHVLTPSRPAESPAPSAAQDAPQDRACEELCGTHIGDRRVRVQRTPRTVSQKVASAVRRALSR